MNGAAAGRSVGRRVGRPGEGRGRGRVKSGPAPLQFFFFFSPSLGSLLFARAAGTAVHL